ncbi:MAG: cadherin-like beta sandwich domain-containing protein [Candidatus Paceibacterota bacterium]|jgi:hypothetical protein
MKKVYLGLFALAISLSALGVYATMAPVLLFSDSFEGGNFNNWTTADKGAYKWAVLPGILIKVQDGKKDAEVSRILKKPSTDWKLAKNISTVGYDNLTLSFYYLIPRLGHLESNDHFVVECFDGTTWQKVGDITNTDTGKSWQLASFSLPAGTNNNTNFAFRLRAQFSPEVKGLDALDTVIIDNVKLMGQAIPPAITTYVITASAGEGGTISPSGPVSVKAGSDINFIITANPGYQNANKKVDGANVGGQIGANDSYNFTSVNANHIIEVFFMKGNDANLGDLTLSNGTLSPAFHPNKLAYEVELPEDTTVVPTVNVRTNDRFAIAEVAPAITIPGTTTIRVMAQDGVSELTYTVAFTVAKHLPLATLNVSLSPYSPNSSTIFATGGEKENIPLLAFDIKAQRGDAVVTSLKASILKLGIGTADITAVYLYDGPALIASAIVDPNGLVSFYDITTVILRDSRKTFTLKINIKNISGGPVTLSSSVNGSDIIASDANDDAVVPEGSAVGTDMTIINSEF